MVAECKDVTIIDGPIPIEKLVALRLKGMAYTDIAKLIGRSKQAVWQRLQPIEESLEALPDFKSCRADLLALHQQRLLSSLTGDDIKKASAYQRVGMFSLLYDKERLERGETTQNIGYADYTKALSSVIAKRTELEAELGIDSTVSPDDEQDT